MASPRLTRRDLIRGLTGAAALPILVACTPAAAPTATTAPTKAPEPTKPAAPAATTAPAATAKPAEAAKPTEAPKPTAVATAAPAKAEAFKMVAAAHWNLKTNSGWPGVVEAFQKKHPGVEMETQEIPYSEYDVKLLTQVAAGTVPDVLAVGNAYNWSLVKKGVLTDMNTHMAQLGAAPTDYFKAYLAERTFDGKIYSIPYDLQPNATVFYNKQLFAEAGVKAPSQDYTWEDVRAMAKQLTKIGSDGKVSVYGALVGVYHLLHSYAGGYVDNASEPTKGVLDTPEAIQGVQLLLDMMYKDQSNPSPQSLEGLGIQAVDLFATGRIAMMQNGWWLIVNTPDKLAKVDVGAFVGPTGPGGKRAYGIGNTSFGVAKMSKRLDLATEFVVLLLNTVGWEAAWKASKGNIFPPAHKAAYEAWLKYPEGPLKESRSLNGYAAEYGVFQPRHGRWTEINTKFVAPEIDLVMRNKKPVAETMKSISQKVTEELKKP